MDMEWMAWTPLTAIFFIVIACILAGMALWEKLSPTVERRGFLPMATTRGDRLFIGLLGSAYIYLAWIFFTQTSIWCALPVAVTFLVLVMWRG